MTESLKDKVAIVTGASSGIGEATVEALVQQGVKVAAVARRKDRLEALAKKFGAQVLPIEADVSNEEQSKKSVEQTIEKWGRVDIFVPNAGVMLLSPVRESKMTEWRNMVNVNILGLMYGVYQVLPQMTKQKSGHIITISSIAGRKVLPNGAVYCATKYAVRAFSEVLRQEVCKEGIRVTIVEPGAVETELTDHISHSGTKKSMEQMFSSMDILKSEDIANLILYAVQQPSRVDVCEILILPTKEL